MRRVTPVVVTLTLLIGVGLAPTAWGADTYEVDVAHTTVGFTVRHLVINKVRGRFGKFKGTIVYDEKNLAKSSVQGVIRAESIDTDHPKRDKHLRSDDFFSTASHPDITFKSHAVEKGENRHILIGELTMRGVTQEVRIPFEITGKIKDPLGKTRIGFEARVRINRQDFGISYSKVMDNGGLVVGNTVNIELVGEAVKQES